MMRRTRARLIFATVCLAATALAHASPRADDARVVREAEPWERDEPVREAEPWEDGVPVERAEPWQDDATPVREAEPWEDATPIREKEPWE